ncbi:MAG: calcium/sodium antiporter [Gemmatimonadota bacterium]
MPTLPPWLNGLIALGSFFAIAAGAKYVVDSAATLAHRLGFSQLVIGLTVVALGTSAPEFGVTLVAAFEGRSSISVGNIVGSNIFNLGFILGGAAAFAAIPTDRIMVWRDALALAGGTLVLYLLVGVDLSLGFGDGLILLGCLAAYLLLVWRGRRAGTEDLLTHEVEDLVWLEHSVIYTAAILLLGFAIIGVSSHFLIGSASALARSAGVSEWVIAVTVVAAGTSVPEIATTLAGVARGHTALSAGNVIGSDLFNVLGVLGVAGVLHPMVLQPEARPSLIALSGMVAVVLLMMRSGWRLSRTEGVVLLALAALRWALDFLGRGV